MKRPVLVLGVMSMGWVLAACPANHSGGDDDYMIQPGGPGGYSGAGGGGGGGGATGDGGIDALTGDAGVLVNGRACLLTDMRQIGVTSACAATGAGNLTVSIGNRTATTTATGAFTIIVPTGGGLPWHVTGDGQTSDTAIQPSVMPYGTDATIPVITTSNYTSLESQNSVVGSAEQQGSMFVRVLQNGAPAANIAATSSLASQRGALYDGGTSVVWNDNITGTGAAGVVWIPGIQLGQTGGVLETVSLTPSGTATTPQPFSATVEDQAITFLTVELQ